MDDSTNIYGFPDAKGIVVSGDIHGDYEKLVYKCCIQYGMRETLIVVAGDCGFGFNKPGYYEGVYMRVSNRLAKANNWIVFIRGNHDNPAYFDGKQVRYKRWMYENRMETGDGKLTPYVYWPDEAPVYDETRLDAIDRQCAVDVVITHTAPSFCELTSHHFIQEWLDKDKDLLEDIRNERKVMDDIHAYLYAHSHPLQYWYYGHFHESWHGEIEGVKYNMLDISELRELQ